jgi:hypothetical protein
MASRAQIIRYLASSVGYLMNLRHDWRSGHGP